MSIKKFFTYPLFLQIFMLANFACSVQTPNISEAYSPTLTTTPTEGDEIARIGLYIYNTTVSEVMEVCPVYGDIFGNLIWSPDSRYIAYTAEQEERALPNPLVVVDLLTGSVYEVAKDASLIGGWSDKFHP